MVAPVDRAAFLAALAQAAAPRLRGVTLPGIGACYMRPVTAGDVFDAESARAALTAAGVEIKQKVNIAIGLAQSLCDESGAPLLDPANADHIRQLLALPWETVSAAMQDPDAPAAAGSEKKARRPSA